MNSQKSKKKVLRIRKGEYLLAMQANGVATTANREKAMDISNWSLEELGYIVSNLKRIGYKKTAVETIENATDETKAEKIEAILKEMIEKEEKYDSSEEKTKSKKLKKLFGYGEEQEEK